MVSSATKISDSGYSIALGKSYSGRNAYHWYWYVYPDDTAWYWSDKHGSLPRTVPCYFSFRRESSSSGVTPAIHECSFVSKFNDFEYIVSITNSWAVTASQCASISILNMYANESATPGDNETITVDIKNIGGNGKFDLILLDNGVEIDKLSGKDVSGKGSTRNTLSFIMLNHTMNLVVKLVDLYDNTVVDEIAYSVSIFDPCEGVLCEPMCVGFDSYDTFCEEGTCVRGGLMRENDPECGYMPPPVPGDDTFIDLLMDNKEIVILAIVAGVASTEIIK